MLEFSLPYNLTADLAAVADVVAAAVVTTHVLLTKRDVRGSIGWIGLAWLSPLLGSLLYVLFGINRVARRAARRRRQTERAAPYAAETHGSDSGSEHDERTIAIARVGDRLTRRAVLAGNAISSFRSGVEAYPAMLGEIQTARRSIALASYIFRADRVGNVFIEALRSAHTRGVEVRVLVDGIGSGYFMSSAANELRRSGIRVERFLHEWLPWRMSFLNMRNHKKLLIVDGAVGFAGGLNLGAENLSPSRPAYAVDDVHFRIQGPAVSTLMQSFAKDWAFTCGESLKGDVWWPEILPVSSVRLRGISSGPDDDEGSIETIFAAVVGSAKSRLRIVTPYFLPDQRLMSDIMLASLRGITVEIVVPANSNHKAIDWAMRSHLGFFAGPGVAVYLTPPPFDHSKMVTVDGLWAGLGSPNWDLRSLRLNFEFLLECYDAPFVAELDRLIDEKIANSTRLTFDRIYERPLPIKLRDAVARLFLPYL